MFYPFLMDPRREVYEALRYMKKNFILDRKLFLCRKTSSQQEKKYAHNLMTDLGNK